MQYHIQTLVKHLFDRDSFEQVTEQELKQFTEDYPYAAVGQFLYAKKLKDSGSQLHVEQSEQASLYFHNALWLRWQLDHEEEAPVLPVKSSAQLQPGFRMVTPVPQYDAPIDQEAVSVPDEQEEPAQADIVAAAEATEPPVHAVAEPEALAEQEEDNSHLQVNENGSLIAQAEERDEIVPAVEVPAEIADVKTVQPEVDDIIPAVEITTKGLEDTDAPDDVVPAVDVPVEMKEETLSSDTLNNIEATEQQPVEATTETTAATTAFAAETETPATEEPVVDNTNATPPPVVEAPEQPAAVEPVAFTVQPVQQQDKGSVDPGEPIFESYHTIDYFASQGIKLRQEDFKDQLGKQLKSFTDWLRSMKRIGPLEPDTSLDEVTNQSIQRIAEHSVEEKEVLTEAMAEVWVKQGNPAKAIRVYEKLSLLNPGKSPYFAGRIEQLKAQ